MTLSVVILAAGNGKRMHSSLPKVLHQIGGTPLLLHVVKTAKSLNPESIYIVYGQGGEKIQEALKDIDLKWVLQPEQKGTGHALLQALPQIPDDHRVLVLYGDVPLIKTSTLEKLLSETKPDELGILVACLENPNGFGRIIKNDQGEIIAIVEHKDATSEQLAINEINTGILTATALNFKKWLPNLSQNNVQGEYYLTDVISMAVDNGVKISSNLVACNKETSGVNDRKELIALERYYQLEKAQELLLQGVNIMDPARFDCRGEISASRDVVIDIDVIFQGTVILGEGSTVGPYCVLKNVTVGKNVLIHPHCVIEDAEISDNCIVGPFARIRPNTYLDESVHIGNFVELKNTKVGHSSKVNHLTYLGDATIGKKVNVGAGTITCNYDGYQKFHTTIQDGAFIGSGTELVAPVTIGEKAYIGAGSTITKDAPEEQLTLGRAKQVTIKNWKKKPDHK